MSISVPVTWQMVVNTHDGEFHLFQLDDTLPILPVAGLLLAGVDGIPNVTGPAAGCDNGIARMLYHGQTKRVMCQLLGYRAATQTLAEVKVELSQLHKGWKYIATIPKDSIRETGAEDIFG